MSTSGIVVRQLKLGTMDNFVYVIGDPTSREAAVVDPAWNVDAILETAERESMRIKWVLLTHHHPDHASGAREVCDRTGAGAIVGEADRRRLRLRGLDFAAEAAAPRLGRRKVEVLATPGHTLGSQCYLVGRNLFTGDTLFIGGCGRRSLGECTAAQMLRSLRDVLLPLPDATVVWPGHDYDDVPSARLGEVKRRNRALQIEDAGEFERYITGPRWPDEE